MDLDHVFLGTSGSMPTSFRGAPALLVRRGGERLLFDCGEGTQRQLLTSAVGLVDLREVFLTHYHADHYLGLPGMLKTFAMRGREEPITIYGPAGLGALFADLRRIFGKLTYEYTLVELRPGDRFPRDGYVLDVFPVLHGRNAVGYTLLEDERPGRFDVPTADALGVPARSSTSSYSYVSFPKIRRSEPNRSRRPGGPQIVMGSSRLRSENVLRSPGRPR